MIKIKNNIIFLGPPGSGKGTISSLLEKEIDIKQISTGDIFREEIANKTKLGLHVKKIVESGQYVPDDITNEIVKNKIEKLDQSDENFILDGYPRTKMQAEFLTNLPLTTKFIVINLEIPNNEIVKRLGQRWFCSQCKATFNETNLKSSKHPYCENDNNLLIQREDDKPESIKKRLEVYQAQTSPLIEYYKNQNILISIDANDNVENILLKIKSKLIS